MAVIGAIAEVRTANEIGEQGERMASPLLDTTDVSLAIALRIQTSYIERS
jgi:hypothetical protein